MIRMIQSQSAAHAKQYFSEALSQSDYYLSDQELPGRFSGKIADRLDILGSATKELFHSLCENVHPITGETLTPRKVKNRTTGYDINFHVPKSVSVLHVLSKDNHILDAFQESVHKTMLDIEQDAKTRVRKNNQDDNRKTGELLWAEFIHQTARPVDGSAPDPHLHCHCFTLNVTWDNEERQYKAGQFQFIKRDMPYYQARFHKRLADKLVSLGYTIRRTTKSFEVSGIPQPVIDQFSKRTNEIGQFAKANNIKDAKQLDKIGSLTRSKKQKGLNMNQLKAEWRRQVHLLGKNDNKQSDKILRGGKDKSPPLLLSSECIDYAIKHRFERNSVMQDRRVLESAYKYALGFPSISLDNISKAFADDRRVIHVKEADQAFCTTHEVLSEESRMIELVKSGRGKFIPLYKNCPSLSLSEEQTKAVEHVLTTQDQVSVIEGRAGTGKTTLMQEASRHIKAAGKNVVVAAPTSQAARDVLRNEGFEEAETVAKLLSDNSLQDKLKGQVLWVDEAGLLGVKELTSLIEIAKKYEARIILGGDTRQHSSVPRGDALRLITLFAGIQSATISTIYRQKNSVYRRAVQSIANGDMKDAFEHLETLGAIHQVDHTCSENKLVSDYMSAIKRGKSALVVSPTHKQGEEITDVIRKKLKESKQIADKEVSLLKLINLNMTEAEKSDLSNYREGYVLQFTQNLQGIKNGSRWVVSAVNENNLLLTEASGKKLVFAGERKKEFDIYQQTEINVSKGDLIRVTRNGMDSKKKRINNGQSFQVVSTNKKNMLVVRNVISKVEYSISKDFGHIAHAYCITSHASQGKTVDTVFVSQPASTFPATDLKQFYVSVSRGRESVNIYTDDKQALFEHASYLRYRTSGVELTRKRETGTKVTQESVPVSNLVLSPSSYKIKPSFANE
jgi:conjugative relaxase-like TrwC/TraI family protein